MIMSIVQQVAALRKHRGTSARTIAERSGVHTPNIYAIEHGRRDPAASTLERIAEAAGVKLLAVDTDGIPFVFETARVLQEAVAANAPLDAYRQLIQLSDDLVAADAATAGVLAHTPPTSLLREWKAAVAGIVEWRLQSKGTPLPSWLNEGAALQGPWRPFEVPYEIDEAAIPEPLRRRGVWIEEGELTSA